MLHLTTVSITISLELPFLGSWLGGQEVHRSKRSHLEGIKTGEENWNWKPERKKKTVWWTTALKSPSAQKAEDRLMLKFSEDTQVVFFRSEPEQRFKLKKAVKVYRSWAEANRTVLSPCVFVSVSVCVAARAICCAATPADPGTQWTVSGTEGFHRWRVRPPAAAHAYVDPKNTQVKQWTCEDEATHLFLFVCKKKQKYGRNQNCHLAEVTLFTVCAQSLQSVL